MKLKLFLVVTILGTLMVTEGRFPRLRLDPNGRLDPEVAAKLTSKVQNAIDGQWMRHTKEEDSDYTLFHADTLDSDIRGKMMTTLFDEREVYAYQGFRFGKAERFSPPVDQDNYWGDETFNATHIGPKCPQGSMDGGDEDCLFLNVYTPYKPGTDKAENLAVMFFIHGGAFIMGDAASYLPTKLLNYDVILVTTHYRLGAFGFYTRDSPKAPGNAALYDMISALRWVQRHISDFGGNPELVTIFGESAGSVSVNYMMLLTGNENLFRGVIAESGSALDHWALDEDKFDGQYYATTYLESYFGCNKSEDEDEILLCMRKVPAQDLVSGLQHLISMDRKNGLIGFRGCSPTIQTFEDTDDVKKIFYQEPREYIIKREFKDVPFMTGANREEGSLIVAILYFDYLLRNHLLHDKDYLREEMMRDLLLSVGIKDEPEGIAKTLQRTYCDGVDLADLLAAQYCLIDIGGVMFLKAGSWQMSNYHSYYSNSSTFYYSFEFESDDSLLAVGNPDGVNFYAGISHGDELKYIFSAFVIMDDYADQKSVYERMILLWTNFARYLNPTPEEDKKWVDLKIPPWTPYKFEKPHFMLIQTEFSIKDDYADRWTITNDLFGPQVTNNPDECVELCADYEDKKDKYEITMIVFIVAFFLSCSVAIFFIFKRT